MPTDALTPGDPECIYCGASGPLMDSDEGPPPTSDTDAWAAIEAQHLDGCEWVETRAHRLDGCVAP